MISIVGIKKRLLRREKPTRFGDSRSYWDDRYRRGSDSVPGSLGRLADFKADIVNDLAVGRSVIEWGCGDGSQLAHLAPSTYIGVDVSSTAVRMCEKRFADDATKTFLLLNQAHRRRPTADLALSLDVVYHLIEDEVFDRYMRDLFGSASQTIVIYSSNYDKWPEGAPHVRHRRFTDWIDENVGGWTLDRHVANRYPFDPRDPKETSHSDFYIYRRR